MRVGGELEVVRMGDLESSTPAGHRDMDTRFIVRDVDRLVFQHCEMAPGGGADAHVHDEQNQIFYMLEGALRVTGRGHRSVTVSAGEALLIPAGVPHATRNEGRSAARYLVLTSPR